MLSDVVWWKAFVVDEGMNSSESVFLLERMSALVEVWLLQSRFNGLFGLLLSVSRFFCWIRMDRLGKYGGEKKLKNSANICVECDHSCYCRYFVTRDSITFVEIQITHQLHVCFAVNIIVDLTISTSNSLVLYQSFSILSIVHCKREQHILGKPLTFLPDLLQLFFLYYKKTARHAARLDNHRHPYQWRHTCTTNTAHYRIHHIPWTWNAFQCRAFTCRLRHLFINWLDAVNGGSVDVFAFICFLVVGKDCCLLC